MRPLARRWLAPALGLFGAIFVLTHASSLLAGRPFDLGAYTSIQFVLNTNAEALASTLGILMAIVLLMVQLTAQRYSFNIIGMFARNPRNIALVVLFIITISFNLWLAAAIDEDFIPALGTYLALGLGTVCFALLIPYFSFLFDSLTPHNLLNAMQAETLRAIDRAISGQDLQRARREAAEKVQHTGDVTRTAASLSDADVARHSVWTLYGTFCGYLARKPSLPREWFAIDDRFFRGRHALIVKQIEESGTWFERRIFEEFQAAFAASLHRLEPLNTSVALCYRLAGERALERGEDATLRLLTRFFNTLLRAALNARDARAGYHLLYQYDLLADAAIESRPELALEIVERIAYYGETAIGMRVFWMAVAAGQDLRILAETSVKREVSPEITSSIQQQLLRLLQCATSHQAQSVAMLRKAVLALGAFQLAQGNVALAEELALGLQAVQPEELDALAAELARVTDYEFWELTDRVANFDYLEEGPRARLDDLLVLVATIRQSRGNGLAPLEVAD